MCDFEFDTSLGQAAGGDAVSTAAPNVPQPPPWPSLAAIRRRLACCSLVRCSLAFGVAIALAPPAAWGQSGAAMAVGSTARESMEAAADSSADMAGSAEMGSGSLPPAGSPAAAGGPSGGPSGPFGARLLGNLGIGTGPGGAGPGGQNRGLAIGGGDVAALAAGSLAEFFSRPLDGVAGAGQPSLREQAAVALHRGDPQRALALFHAHLVAERDAASDGHAAVQYSALLRRPVWALRLGVSLNAKVPADLVDDPQPIREGDRPAGRGEFGADAQATGPARGGRRRTARAQPAELELAMQEEMAAQEMSAEAGMGEMGMAAGDEMNAAGIAAGMGVNAAAGGEDALVAAARESEIVNEIFDRDLGLVAQVLKDELSKRISGGSFGGVLGELTAQGGALAAQGIAAVGPTAGGSVPPTWIPGVEYLGNGIAAQTLEQAKQRQLDLLLHFEVIVKETRGEENQYLARLRVVDVAGGETLGASRLMNRRDVTLAARRSSVQAVVEELMQPALAAIDTKAAVTPLPQLAPQHAASRIERLLGGPQEPGIAELAEIVMFHHRGLIDEEQLEQAMFYAAGEEGLRLLYDDYEQRVALATERALSELE